MYNGNRVDVASAWVQANLAKGVRCPCCGQLAKLYRRKLTSAMVKSLVAMYRRAGVEFVHVPTIDTGDPTRRGGDAAKLRFWNLIEEMPEARPDGGRAGWWRVTRSGVAFLTGGLTVPKYVLIYDNEFFGYSGEAISVREACGNHFNFDELMTGV
jgi:hypothetical protein